MTDGAGVDGAADSGDVLDEGEPLGRETASGDGNGWMVPLTAALAALALAALAVRRRLKQMAKPAAGPSASFDPRTGRELESIWTDVRDVSSDPPRDLRELWDKKDRAAHAIERLRALRDEAARRPPPAGQSAEDHVRRLMVLDEMIAQADRYHRALRDAESSIMVPDPIAAVTMPPPEPLPIVPLDPTEYGGTATIGAPDG